MHDRPRSRTRLGPSQPGLVLLVASVFWAGAGLISTAAPLGGTVLAFWRCLVGAAIYSAVLWFQGHRPRLADLRVAWLGGLGFGFSVVFLFVAFKTTTLLSANVIGCLQPLVLGFIAHRYSERLGGLLWAATAAAAVGTAIVVVGSSDHSGTWSLAGDLCAALGIAANIVYVLGTKRARHRMGALDYQAAMLWVAAAVVLPIALVTASGGFVPDPVAWWSVLGLVTVGGTGHLLFSAAQRHVSVAASSASLLAEVLFVSLAAVPVFGQSINLVQAVGIVIVAASVGVWLVKAPIEQVPDEPLPDQPPL